MNFTNRLLTFFTSGEIDAESHASIRRWPMLAIYFSVHLPLGAFIFYSTDNPLALLNVVFVWTALLLGFFSFHYRHSFYPIGDSIESGCHLIYLAAYTSMISRSEGGLVFLFLTVSLLLAYGFYRGTNYFTLIASFVTPFVYISHFDTEPILIMSIVAGSLLFYVVVSRATDTRVLEQRATLKDSEDRFHLMADNAIDMISRHTPDLAYQFASPSYATGLGYSHTELKGRNLIEFVHPEDQPGFDRRMTHARDFKPRDTLTLQFRFRDGTSDDENYIWVESTFRFIRDEESQEIIDIQMSSMDITERKETEERLRQIQKMEAVGQLASGIAHEFNNLLMVIMGNVEMADMDLNKGDLMKIETRFEDIRKTCFRSRDLIQQLLVFGRKSNVEMKPIDINKLIHEIARVAASTFDRRIKLEIDAPDTANVAMADRGQVYQVLLNLCVNGSHAVLEHAQNNPDLETLEIRVNSERVKVDASLGNVPDDVEYGQYVRISVADTGTGMSQEVQEKIFEPFFTTKPAGKGTGLGLAMVFSLVKQHGGWIDVESEVGKGTTFYVYLPAAADGEAVESGSSNANEERYKGKETLLIVDEEENIRELFRINLERLGYEVLLAATGEEGIELLRTRKDELDLAIFNYVLPDMTGKAAVEEILGIDSATKLIITTGFSADEERQSLLELGNIRLLNKPFTYKELAETVRAMLDNVEEPVAS